ncbi:hypothetical protein Dimus_021815 [Dionaea muscipula]
MYIILAIMYNKHSREHLIEDCRGLGPGTASFRYRMRNGKVTLHYVYISIHMSMLFIWCAIWFHLLYCSFFISVYSSMAITLLKKTKQIFQSHFFLVSCCLEWESRLSE